MIEMLVLIAKTEKDVRDLAKARNVQIKGQVHRTETLASATAGLADPGGLDIGEVAFVALAKRN
jgi:hypothetical protein